MSHQLLHHSSHSEGGPCLVKPENFPMCASVLEGGPSQKVSSASNLASSFLLLSIWGVGTWMDGWEKAHGLEGFGPKKSSTKSGISARKPCGTFWMGISMEGFHKHVEQNGRARFRATSFGVEHFFRHGDRYLLQKRGTFINPKLTLTGIKPVESQKVATKRTINHHIST